MENFLLCTRKSSKKTRFKKNQKHFHFISTLDFFEKIFILKNIKGKFTEKVHVLIENIHKSLSNIVKKVLTKYF